MQHVFTDAFGLDLAVFNASDRWMLPVPATFVIDKEGAVRRAHVDPDFMKRLEPREIIDQRQKL